MNDYIIRKVNAAPGEPDWLGRTLEAKSAIEFAKKSFFSNLARDAGKRILHIEVISNGKSIWSSAQDPEVQHGNG